MRPCSVSISPPVLSSRAICAAVSVALQPSTAAATAAMAAMRLAEIAPVMARSVVAAEDANFCLHLGFDMAEIRRVVASGQQGGASTISQQLVKNVYLSPSRNPVRKLSEAILTYRLEENVEKNRIEIAWPRLTAGGPTTWNRTGRSS